MNIDKDKEIVCLRAELAKMRADRDSLFMTLAILISKAGGSVEITSIELLEYDTRTELVRSSNINGNRLFIRTKVPG